MESNHRKLLYQAKLQTHQAPVNLLPIQKFSRYPHILSDRQDIHEEEDKDLSTRLSLKSSSAKYNIPVCCLSE